MFPNDRTYWICFLAPLPGPLYLATSLCRRSPGQPSRAAIPAVPSTAAPSARASTTTTWCVSPATKATLWKDHRRPSARPTASGASSHPRAEVWPNAPTRAEKLSESCMRLDCMCGQVKPQIFGWYLFLSVFFQHAAVDGDIRTPTPHSRKAATVPV